MAETIRAYKRIKNETSGIPVVFLSQILLIKKWQIPFFTIPISLKNDPSRAEFGAED